MANDYTGGNTANVGNGAYYLTIDGVDSGLCEAPTNFTAAVETKENQFLQDSSARGAQVAKQTLEIDVTLAELTDENFRKYLANLATISGSDLLYGDKKGQHLDTFEIKLYPLHADGHPLAGRVITIHKAYIVPNGSIVMDPTEDAFETLPIKLVAVKDTNQSAGEEFLKISAADTTAPTVSTTYPTDNATEIAVDDNLTILFSGAMAEAAINTDHIFIMKSDFSASVEIRSITLNAAKTLATISHTEFSASTEYRVFITGGVRSAAGVHMVSPYEWDFTTAT